ncbi:MAG: translation initiation factor IF-2 N-terminal domain-containing protein, partial [Coriobacteriia bacterium]|nr:translation initiation factor IF-2 N-terminal domain-containing protein [Coriobacteriia bacterium]
MADMRVHELAKEFGMENKEFLARLIEMKIPVKSHSSTLNDAFVARIRKQLEPEMAGRVAQAEAERQLEAEKQAEEERQRLEDAEAERRLAVEQERARRRQEQAEREGKTVEQLDAEDEARRQAARAQREAARVSDAASTTAGEANQISAAGDEPVDQTPAVAEVDAELHPEVQFEASSEAEAPPAEQEETSLDEPLVEPVGQPEEAIEPETAQVEQEDTPDTTEQAYTIQAVDSADSGVEDAPFDLPV